MNNLRSFKLWLTTEIINRQNQSNILRSIRELMHNAKEQAGKFLEIIVLNTQSVGGGLLHQEYAIRYERCTLSVDLMTNETTQQQYLSNFDLR